MFYLLFKFKRVFLMFLMENNKVKRIKPIKAGLFMVSVCPGGGWFLPAASIFGQKYAKNMKFGTVLVYLKIFWKNTPFTS